MDSLLASTATAVTMVTGCIYISGLSVGLERPGPTLVELAECQLPQGLRGQ